MGRLQRPIWERRGRNQERKRNGKKANWDRDKVKTDQESDRFLVRRRFIDSLRSSEAVLSVLQHFGG